MAERKVTAGWIAVACMAASRLAPTDLQARFAGVATFWKGPPSRHQRPTVRRSGGSAQTALLLLQSFHSCLVCELPLLISLHAAVTQMPFRPNIPSCPSPSTLCSRKLHMTTYSSHAEVDSAAQLHDSGLTVSLHTGVVHCSSLPALYYAYSPSSRAMAGASRLPCSLRITTF